MISAHLRFVFRELKAHPNLLQCTGVHEAWFRRRSLEEIIMKSDCAINLTLRSKQHSGAHPIIENYVLVRHAARHLRK
jgi:hypothetical protein